MRFYISSLVAALVVVAELVAASHSSTANSHARRSFDINKRQLDLGGIVAGVGDGLGGVVAGAGDGLGGVVGGVVGTPTDTSTTTDTTSTSTTTTTTTTDTTTASTTSTTDTSTSTITTAPDAPVTPAPASSDPNTSTTDCGLLGLNCVLTPILSPVLSPVTSLLDPTSVVLTTADPSITPAPSVTPAPQPSDVPSSTPGDILTSIIGGVSSILDPPPPVTSDPVTSDPGTGVVTPPPTSVVSDLPTTTPDGGILTSIISVITSVIPPPPTSLPPTSVPITSEPITTDPPVPPTSLPVTSLPPTGVTDVPTSIITQPPTSLPPTITFPDPITTSVITTALDPNGNLTTTVAPPNVTTSISIDPGLSFILTESSLAFASIPTTTAVVTQTDPDAVVTTTTGTANPTVVATAVSLAPLPTGIPARIYPRDQLDPDANMAGFTLVSILFNQELNWPFVVDSQISSSQIFAYVPVLITTALGIAGDQVKTWALQVYVPTTYRTAADQVELGTMWLGYIPSDLVDTLAAEIKAKQSKFYTGVSDVVAQSLADRVNSGFSLRSVADPNTTSNGGDNSNTAVGASSNDSKSRQDAIIGVVSALGAIAVLVLVFLVYRSMKRRRQLAHRRLSDPPVGDMDFVGARPEGQDFDQDSVGGARRRSFYYAEDSLRGFEGQQPVAGGQGPNEMGQYSRTSPVLSQRRNVVPGMISGPVLQENSMNW